MKKLFLLLFFIFMVNSFFGYVQCGVYAQSESATSVNVGNKICHVTGNKVDGKTTYEYQGKIYNFCCPARIDEFKKDPEKYIKKVEEELKSQPKDVKNQIQKEDTKGNHKH
ncbi:MAG: YHS domain-containing protein [Candidatus Omnitrophica bacterium]|nr:YHS domain-containing protein [Candidatus Omnitrophota bacterium]